MICCVGAQMLYVLLLLLFLFICSSQKIHNLLQFLVKFKLEKFLLNETNRMNIHYLLEQSSDTQFLIFYLNSFNEFQNFK